MPENGDTTVDAILATINELPIEVQLSIYANTIVAAMTEFGNSLVKIDAVNGEHSVDLITTYNAVAAGIALFTVAGAKSHRLATGHTHP